MNLAITPIITQQKNNQSTQMLRSNPSGGGGELPLNGLKSIGARVFHLPAFGANESGQNINSSNLAPLARDTVSFSGNKAKVVKNAVGAVADTVNGLRADKVVEGRIDDFNFQIACELERDAVVPMGYFQNVMNKYFKKYVSVENGDDRIIQALQFRIKSAEHIDEKLNSVGFKAKKNAEEEGGDIVIYRGKKDAAQLLDDIIGGRIVLRDSSKKSVKKVLQILGQIVKDGKFKVKEVESFRPMITSVPEWVQRGYQKDLGIKLDDKKIKMMARPEFFNYADGKDFAEFVETCRGTYPNISSNSGKNLPNGYQAIHVNFILPDGSTGELQIMGRDIEYVKDLIEDAVYKKKCNKKVAYEPLDKRLAPLADKNETELQNKHVEYTRWMYIGERLKAPESFTHKARDRYLSAPKEILARGLGYNQLAPLCRAAKNAAKAEKAAKAKD